MWQSCIKQVHQHHFSSSIWSLCIFVSHFDNSHNITNFFIIIFVVVICGQWGLMLLLCLTEGSGDGYCFSAMKYFSIKVCIHFLDIMLLYTYRLQYVLSCFNYVWLFATLWTIAHQSALSMGFSRQEDWSGLPWPPPGDLPDPGFKPSSLMFPALAGRFFTTRVT